MEPSAVGTFVGQVMNDQFALIATLTFFLCEAIFAAFPVERSRMKQLTSLVVGGILGLFIVTNRPPFDAILQGILAGGATTITVAKFKKPSVDPTALPPAPVTQETTMWTPSSQVSEEPVQVIPAPIEHL